MFDFRLGRRVLGACVAIAMLAGCSVMDGASHAGSAVLGASPGYWIDCTHRSYDIPASRLFDIKTKKRTTVTLSAVAADVFVSADGENALRSEIVLTVPPYRGKTRVAPGKPIRLEFGMFSSEMKISQTEDELSRGYVSIRFRECQDWVTGGP